MDPEVCLGEHCGCNRLCTRIFRCPGLIWDEGEKRARIDEVICAGCGVCASICPSGAIVKRPVTISLRLKNQEKALVHDRKRLSG